MLQVVGKKSLPSTGARELYMDLENGTALPRYAANCLFNRSRAYGLLPL
jgi:hypothetical protein